uniref:NADH-ubiquinone oxidoreductase chain 3 n=1 Tax=Ophiocomina nigra TaxID=55617 RepID=D3H5U4_9ECHI|nr:NADH dehydrogenase subunit 3 [Ophiocomina nigra]
MSLLITFFTITLILTTALSAVGQVLPIHNPDIEKASPYECGFDPINSSRLPFSFLFFLIAILFLIFDLEIVLLLPLPFTMFNIGPQTITSPFIIFILILTIGLIYEWVKGGLEWAEN